MEKEEAMAVSTVPEMFWHGVQTRGPKTMYRQKEFGIWQPVSWQQLGRIAREIGMGLVSLGYEPGEVASILSNTNREWMASDLGALGAAGVVNGIYPTDAPSQVEYLLSDSGSVHCFVEDEEQLDKLLEVRARLPKLRKIIVFDMEGLHDLQDPQVLSLEKLRALGAEYDGAHPGEWERRIHARKAEDLAILVYTSGTTGKPKGAMLSHANLMSSVRSYGDNFSQSDNDERMAFLPLAHVAERVVGVYTALNTGTVLNFVENPETVPENVREIAPTVFGAVPRVWEKFYSGVLIGLKEAGPLQQLAYKFAIGVGYRQAKLREERKAVPALLAFQFWLARVLVLNNVRKLIGTHRARLLVTGAAPISPSPVDSVMPQTSTMSRPSAMYQRTKPGSIGPSMPGAEIRISPEGEILVRGPNVFMGYLNQPEKTRETIDPDGWLHTGDVGVLDERGYLRITDRLKDMYIAGGFNCYPAEIERMMAAHPAIAQVAVIGVPDERLGEVGKAFVVPRPGQRIDGTELIAWCRDKMANYKVPRYVETVAALPTNPSGKVLKYQLRNKGDAHL